MEITNKQAEQVILTLHKNGFKALIVGGAVRDFLQCVSSSDFDVLTDASIDQIHSTFLSEKVKVVGQSFKICLVNKVEVCPARAINSKDDFPGKDSCDE